MKYSKNWPPEVGDIVLFTLNYSVWKGKIVSFDDEHVYIYRSFSGYHKKSIKDVTFLRKKPWWWFW